MTGPHLNVERGILVEITMRDDLIATVNGSEHALIPTSAIDFYFPDLEEARLLVAFLPETEGPTEYLYFAAAPYRRITPDPDFSPDPSSWNRYAGTYRDVTNLDPAWTIQIRREDDELILTGDGEDEVCRPLDHVSFLSSWGLIEFVVEDDGNVPTLVLGKATRYDRVGE